MVLQKFKLPVILDLDLNFDMSTFSDKFTISNLQ